MRNRSGVITGLGNPEPVKLRCNVTTFNTLNFLIEEMLQDILEKGFLEYVEWDVKFDLSGRIFLKVGFEPTYQYDDLKIFHFDTTILSSNGTTGLETGHAWGAYGSDIVSRFKPLDSYTRGSKYSNYMNKWMPKLRELQQDKYRKEIKEAYYLDKYLTYIDENPKDFVEMYRFTRNIKNSFSYKTFKLGVAFKDLWKKFVDSLK